MTTTLHDNIAEWAAPLLTDLGLELYDVEHVGGVLRVTVDRAGGVPLDVIAKLTRALSPVFDEHDPINGHYTLEVSSPGIERRLRTPRHWAGAVGSKVRVKLRSGVADDRRIAGTVSSAEIGSATLQVDGEARRIDFADIDSARTVYEWPAQPKPGGGSPSKSQRAKQAKSSSPTKTKKASS